jgi:hypothetical protein
MKLKKAISATAATLSGRGRPRLLRTHRKFLAAEFPRRDSRQRESEDAGHAT